MNVSKVSHQFSNPRKMQAFFQKGAANTQKYINVKKTTEQILTRTHKKWSCFIGRWRRPRSNALRLHVGDELIRNFSEHLLG